MKTSYLFRPFRFRSQQKNGAVPKSRLKLDRTETGRTSEPPNASALQGPHAQEPKTQESKTRDHRANGPSTPNRRKEERITTYEGIYVVVDTKPQMLGQLIEISANGLAFTFVDLEHASERLLNRIGLNLDLFGAGKGYFVRGLPCRLKSKIENIQASTMTSPQIIRVGVEFHNLTLPQQIQVNGLIRRYNTGNQVTG